MEYLAQFGLSHIIPFYEIPSFLVLKFFLGFWSIILLMVGVCCSYVIKARTSHITFSTFFSDYGQLDEVLLYGVFVSWLGLQTLIGNYLFYTQVTFTIMPYTFGYLIGSLVILPLFLSYFTGVSIFVLLRGVSANLSSGYNYIFDCLNSFSMFARLLLQLTRLAMVFAAAYTFFLYWDEIAYLLDAATPLEDHRTGLYLFTKSCHFLFEVLHFGLIFAIQGFAFFIMTAWLFQFLYATYYSNALWEKL